MNTKELAALLNGREYRKEIDPFESHDAEMNGIVVVFGASDDLMEFRGAIDDELGAYKGTTAYLTSEGLVQNECENDECPHFRKLKDKAATIETMWCETQPISENHIPHSWTFKTTIPHETFEIVEDGEPYCRGIVFALKDVVSKTA